MITKFWSNLNPGVGLPAVPLTIGDAGGSNLLQQVIDLKTVYNRGEMAGIELEVTTGVAAPGANKNLTVFYAFCTKDNRSSVELLTAAASQVCALQNSASVRRVYSLPVNYMGARFLHIWFTQDAMAAGSLITLELSVMAKNLN